MKQLQQTLSIVAYGTDYGYRLDVPTDGWDQAVCKLSQGDLRKHYHLRRM